ncbi:choline BCCT transporter BetT [Corynebacteriaceae bacterium 6-324]
MAYLAKSHKRETSEDPTSTDSSEELKHSTVNKPVFFTAAGLIIAFVLWAWVAPGQTEAVIFGSMDWIAENLGWYYILTAGIIVLFVIVIALTRVGNTRLGPDHSRPKYRMFTWASMLFAAGIGVDLMFFSIAGPATNFLTPPEAAPLSDEAARMAAIWTMFHYGIPGWAMYALMGVALGLFAYRYHLPLSIRSAIAPIFGKRIHGATGNAVDITATLGTIFGIATSLGIGVVFLNYGLSELFGLPTNAAVQVALIALAVLITVLSTVSGVDKGIRRLSELNVLLALGLLLWILVTGKTAELLGQLVQNIGDFFSRFPGMLLNNFAYTEGAPSYPADQWLGDWTLFFWAWWMAWAPFVGLFLARISRGRTLREFIFGVLIIPFGFILLFVSIFGNAALSYFRAGDDAFLQEAVELPESGFFNLLSQFPGGTFLIAVAVFVGMLFYITSADSGSLVMANMTSNASLQDSDGAPWLRIFWAVVTGALTLVMLFIDGVYTLQAAAVLIGLPFSVVMYLLMASVLKALRAESRSLDSRLQTVAIASRGTAAVTDQIPWKERLAGRMAFPGPEEARTFVEEIGTPAVETVALELRELGADVSLSKGESAEDGMPFVDVTIKFPEQEDFKYQLCPVMHETPTWAANSEKYDESFHTVEVFTARGTRGVNVMDFTEDQVIADVVSSYETHLTYMAMGGAEGTSFTGVEAQAPTEWDGTGSVDSELTEHEANSN